VIVGSGFTGIECASYLARLLRNRKATEVELVAASMGYAKKKDYRHRNIGMVVDLGPGYAVANPPNVQLSGFPAKVVTRAYQLYAIPRFVNRWAVAVAYLTDAVFPRSVVSFGLPTQSEAQFLASEAFHCPRRSKAE
jgi:NADH:ubiquinone reductase (H+-translocating)